MRTTYVRAARQVICSYFLIGGIRHTLARSNSRYSVLETAVLFDNLNDWYPRGPVTANIIKWQVIRKIVESPRERLQRSGVHTSLEVPMRSGVHISQPQARKVSENPYCRCFSDAL